MDKNFKKKGRKKYFEGLDETGIGSDLVANVGDGVVKVVTLDLCTDEEIDHVFDLISEFYFCFGKMRKDSSSDYQIEKPNFKTSKN